MQGIGTRDQGLGNRDQGKEKAVRRCGGLMFEV
jgi:hypothetical protein